MQKLLTFTNLVILVILLVMLYQKSLDSMNVNEESTASTRYTPQTRSAECPVQFNDAVSGTVKYRFRFDKNVNPIEVESMVCDKFRTVSYNHTTLEVYNDTHQYFKMLMETAPSSVLMLMDLKLPSYITKKK